MALMKTTTQLYIKLATRFYMKLSTYDHMNPYAHHCLKFITQHYIKQTIHRNDKLALKSNTQVHTSIRNQLNIAI